LTQEETKSFFIKGSNRTYKSTHYELILPYCYYYYTIITSKDQWHLATGLVAALAVAAAVAAPAAAAVATLAIAVAAPAAAVIAAVASVVVVVTIAVLLGRVLLVRGVLRLIQALEPGALDGPDVSPDLRGNPLRVV
jgi:fatty acid desaturase